jgi:hypothetical protein
LQMPKFEFRDSLTQNSVTEAYCAALLNHNNIIKHHQTFIHKGLLVVASEYCAVRCHSSKGRSLSPRAKP